jgi:predicted outer membrane protein
MKGWCMVLAMAGCLWLAVVHAQTPQEYRVAPASPPPPSKPPATRPLFAAESAATARPLEPHERDERRFLKEAAASSRFQVDAARLALARATSPGLRSLATRLSREHVDAANELLRLLHRRGLAPPMLENTQRRALTRLGRLQGARFEREYAAAVVAVVHEEAALCEKASTAVQDPALVDWIAQWLPVLRAQIESAQSLAVVGNGAGHGAPARHARHPAPGERRGVSGSNSR